MAPRQLIPLTIRHLATHPLFLALAFSILTSTEVLVLNLMILVGQREHCSKALVNLVL